MTYKTVSNNEGTHVVLDGVEIAIKPDKVSALDFIAGHAVQRAEAAEALSNTYTGTIDTLVKEKAQAEALAATLQGELNKALAQIAKLDRETRYFQSTDYAADRHLKQFEQTAPVDWREAKQQDDDWDHDTGDLTNDELSDELEP